MAKQFIQEFETAKTIYKQSMKLYDQSSSLEEIGKELKYDEPVKAINKKFDTSRYGNSLGSLFRQSHVGSVIGLLIQLMYVDAHKRALCQRVKTLPDQFNEAVLRRIQNSTQSNTIVDIVDRMIVTCNKPL